MDVLDMGLNESPSEKEGKWALVFIDILGVIGLNESPSEKEGKFWAITKIALHLVLPQ